LLLLLLWQLSVYPVACLVNAELDCATASPPAASTSTIGSYFLMAAKCTTAPHLHLDQVLTRDQVDAALFAIRTELGLGAEAGYEVAYNAVAVIK
jgi:hypothetical protein